MNFNLDDPLGDILSEGSNDSFFDVGPKKKSTPTKSTSAKPATPVSGKFEDLFGIKEPSEQKKAVVDPVAPLKRNSDPPRPSQAPPPKPAPAALFNDDDLISELGFDPKKPKTPKSSILDDILGPMESKKPAAPPSRPLTTGGIPKDEPKVISRQSTDTTESTTPGTASLSRPKTAAVGRRSSLTISNDPLGLFALKDPPPATKEPTPKPKRKGTTADWLGLEPDPKPGPKESAPSEQIARESQPQALTIPEFPPPAIPATVFPTTLNTTPNPLLLTASNIDSQNVLQTLQQQEAQIRLASQMKNQETALREMQRRQQDLLVQQETQFNSLLQKQLARQSQLETTIRAQQDRINAHIQLLMSQPAVIGLDGFGSNAVDSEKINVTNGQQIEEIELRAEVKRLELETLRLSDLVSNVNSNHEKEIEFIENSHKKQIQVLDDNFQNIENRLKQEIKNIEEHFSKKLEISESEKINLLTSYETKIKDMQLEHETIVKQLKDNHKTDLEVLRAEHKNMIENLRQSKLMEFAVMQDNTSYLQTLKSASNHLENVSGDLQTLRDEMYSRIEIEHKERQSKLEAREKQNEDKERRLAITVETAEQERIRLMNLVANLEAQLGKLSLDTSEQQWALRQKLSSLEAERTAFEREMQFARDQLQRDEKRIEELKQFQLNETQRLTQQIQDEKQSILVERAKLETAKKLQTCSATESLKTETEAALKIAQDAARQADQERERYLNMQRQLEARKRDVIDEENSLRQKQDELESVICAAKAKERQVQDVLQRGRLAEQNFNAKLQLIQAQIRQIAEREARISHERVELSRERVELQEIRRRFEINRCSLCKIGEKSAEISQLLVQDNHQDGSGNVANVNFAATNYHTNMMDRLFDGDLAESLKKMNGENSLSADFDHGLCNPGQEYYDNRRNQTNTVPTQTLDSDIMLLNLDIERSFRE